MIWFDLGAWAFVLALMLAYTLYLRRRLAQDPGYTIYALNKKAREAWVEHILHEEARAILGVQTLRNSTMSSTFLASTAILLMIGTLNLASQAQKLVTHWHTFNMLGSRTWELWMVKILLLVVCFFGAFFCFVMSVRLFNHVGYLLALRPGQDDPHIVTSYVAALLNRAGTYYTFGMRAYYAAIPLVLWLFGPLLMTAGATIVLLALWTHDRAP